MRRAGPVYAIRLQARPGADGIRSLRAALKQLWRRHRLRCVSAREIRTDRAPVPRVTHPSASPECVTRRSLLKPLDNSTKQGDAG
jgi:hypothetical protein